MKTASEYRRLAQESRRRAETLAECPEGEQLIVAAEFGTNGQHSGKPPPLMPPVRLSEPNSNRPEWKW